MVENIKVQFVIREHEDKTSKGYDYTRFKCEYQNNGGTKWMSAFKKSDDEKQMVEDLKNSENKLISVEICNPKDDLWNIKKFLGVVAPGLEKQEPMQQDIDNKMQGNFAGAPVQQVDKKTFSGIDYNPTTMYISYVKDLVVAGKDPVDAIKIIKQAHAAFS